MKKFRLKTTFIKENVDDFFVDVCEKEFDKESDLFNELKYQYTVSYDLCKEANDEFIQGLKKMEGRKLDASLEKELRELINTLDEKFLRSQDSEYYFKRDFAIHYIS